MSTGNAGGSLSGMIRLQGKIAGKQTAPPGVGGESSPERKKGNLTNMGKKEWPKLITKPRWHFCQMSRLNRSQNLPRKKNLGQGGPQHSGKKRREGEAVAV